MKYDVFISYSRKDYAEEIINEKGEKEERIIPGNIVSQIIKYLKKNKISYWWDEYGMYSSDEFIETLAEYIAESRILLFISTENSNASKWTPKEISSALHLEKKVIPFRVDNSKYSNSVLFLISDIDFIDYSKDKKKAFKKLEISIKKILEDERLRLEEERKRKEEEERRRQEEEEKKKEKEINKPIKKDAIYYAKTRHWSVNVLLRSMFVVAFGFGVIACLLEVTGEINIAEMWLYISLAEGGVAGLQDILLNNKRGVYILLSLMVIPLCVFIMGYAHTRIFTIPIVFLLSIYIILICIMPIKKNGIRAYNLLEKGRCWISKSRPDDNGNAFIYVLFIAILIIFINLESKNEALTDGDYCKDGMIVAEKYGKYGYIDKTGNIVVPFKYDRAWNFSEGLARVMKDGKRGFIDKTGKEIVPCIYDSASGFYEGLAQVMKDGKRFFIDKTGREVISCEYDSAGIFIEGFVRVEKEGKWGYIDKTGREVIPSIYEDVGWSFSEGLSWVKKDGKYGYVDTTGKEITSFIYDRVEPFIEGLAVVEKDGKYGYIDKTGKEVIPFIYDSAIGFSEGLARVGKDGKSFFIDKTGREVIPPIYKGVGRSFSEGLAQVMKDGGWGFIDKTGVEVIPCEYDETWNFSEGLAKVGRVSSDSFYLGYIDKTGKEVVPLKYNKVGNFSEGLAKVGKLYSTSFFFGYVDKTGKEVIPCKYDKVEDFSEGLAKVEKNGDIFFIDKEGNRVID